MANKKYVIMRNGAALPDDCPVVAADNNKLIKEYQKIGYKIVGRVTCNENFKPCYAKLREVKNKTQEAGA